MGNLTIHCFRCTVSHSKESYSSHNECWVECAQCSLFRESSVMTIRRLNLLQAFKVYNKLLPQYFIDMFITNGSVHSHNTRQCDDFHVPYHRLALTFNSICVYGVLAWNSIREDIRNINSLQSFRTKYKLCLIDS